MDATHEYSAEEVTRLRDCLNDVVSITALPAQWTGGEPAQVVSTLLDALLGMLRLGFACVRLPDAEGGRPFEMVRVAEWLQGTAGAREIQSSYRLVTGRCAFEVAATRTDFPPRGPLVGRIRACRAPR